MNKSVRFSPEVWELAVRLVFEHQWDYPSQWSAMESIAPKIGLYSRDAEKVGAPG